MPSLKKAPEATKRDAVKTRARILDAAQSLFCKHGLDGSTVEAIAKVAVVNKRMVYYYFGGKAELYLAVLEKTYANRRQHDSVLEMTEGDPEQCMRRLVRSSFRYCRNNPDYIKLLLAENLNGAKHLRRSKKVLNLHSPLLEKLGALLERGQQIGLFRAYTDPLQVYLTIASLCFFYHSNNATLSTVFGRDFSSSDSSIEREVHVEDVVLSYLKTRPSVEKKTRHQESAGHKPLEMIKHDNVN
ncbi:MAG: TetR family transcriptional regulator [SAR324 cluster bacterium]|nr:TetR family transcriptional regulator [SAR324 cluster bacterium]